LIGGLILSSARSSGPTPERPSPRSGGSSPEATALTDWTMPAGLTIPDGSLAYVHVVEYPERGQEGSAIDEQSWFSPSDGSGRVAISGVATAPPLDHCADAKCPYASDDDFGPGEMEKVERWLELEGLSTDPVVLAEQLAEPSLSAGSTPTPTPYADGAVADMAGLVLGTAHTATPELKAALSQVLAGLEGAVVDSVASDPVRRPAWSVRLEQGAEVKTWWFDPQSDQLLATVHVDHGLTYFRIYEAAGVVDGTGDASPQPAFIPTTTDVPPGAKA
jgi:hypothetical protein